MDSQGYEGQKPCISCGYLATRQADFTSVAQLLYALQPGPGAAPFAGQTQYLNRPKQVNLLQALHARTSSPRLVEPGPSDGQLENLFNAAFRAADHGLLRPWRFLIVRGEARQRLGELFVQAASNAQPGLSEPQLEKIRNKPLRAPALIVTISSLKEHPKVPEFEQDLSAAAATQNMLLAAYAQELGAMWRTGSLAYNREVMDGLGLTRKEKIIGFLYLGTPAGPVRPLQQIALSDYVEEW